MGVYGARSWRIEPNAGVTVCGWFPVILVATDKIDILGSLAAAATGTNAVAGGFGSSPDLAPGLGPGGGGAGSNANGGGGGSYCGIGGSGGVGMGGPAPAGGMAYGTP